jgi:glutamate/tyrosine decarboxylase-like PLP-dependent enzyme
MATPRTDNQPPVDQDKNIQTNTDTQLVSDEAKAQAEKDAKANAPKKGTKADAEQETLVNEFETHGVAPTGKMSVEQVVSFMSTKPDDQTAGAYADLLKRNKVDNPRATEIELKRLGVFIG